VILDKFHLKEYKGVCGPVLKTDFCDLRKHPFSKVSPMKLVEF
jgi:hypothetical protein